MGEYNIVVIGDAGVGKSSLTMQFCQGIFMERYDPTIEDYYRKQIDMEGESKMLEILDTAGTEQFALMKQVQIKKGDGFVLVYSIISLATFEKAVELQDHILRVKDVLEVPLMFVGNKCDMDDQRLVTTEQGQAEVDKWNAAAVAAGGDPEKPMSEFIETSAKNNLNVEECFHKLAARIKSTKPAKSAAGDKRRLCVLV